MITEAELAQMKADLWERLRVKEKRIVALEREIEELRAALRGLVDASFTYRERATEGNATVEQTFYRAISVARAALEAK